MPPWLLTATVVLMIGVAAPAALLIGSKFSPTLLAVGVVALTFGLVALRSPVFTTIVLLVAMFLRLALSDMPFPVNPFLMVFALLIVATALWFDRTSTRVRSIGPIEWAMAMYLMWNVYSMIAPHKYTAGQHVPLDGKEMVALGVPRFIIVATLIPFVVYAIGRYTFDRSAAVRALLWTLLMLSAYSAAVSIMQFKGPTGWIWPRYIVDAPAWYGRAVGVFNQPVVNGMAMALGLAIAMLLISRRSEPPWLRCVAFTVALGCGYGLYLTHTRAAWLSGAVVLIVGAVLAKGFRKGFVVALCLVATVVALNWSKFISADREAGGVGSTDEIEDRLNTIQTSLWAAKEKPLTGWGIGRFEAVNTYHHQQWSPDTPWIRGYGIISHGNELGILAELGAIGLVLWMSVLVLIVRRLWDASRTLPDDELWGRPLAVTAILAVAILMCTGLTVDLRYFDFPTAAVFLLAGIAIGWCDRYRSGQADPGGSAVAVPEWTRHA